ncbi:MAG: transposase [Ktedonobacteraceae bacterium]|nr:transposase [Ktedonobacteraceae bacterium]
MAHPANQSENERAGQETFQQVVRERRREAVRTALISILEEEVTAFMGAAPYERTQARRDQRNGSSTRDLETGVGHLAE